jgi:hypothetical protein
MMDGSFCIKACDRLKNAKTGSPEAEREAKTIISECVQGS